MNKEMKQYIGKMVWTGYNMPEKAMKREAKKAERRPEAKMSVARVVNTLLCIKVR